MGEGDASGRVVVFARVPLVEPARSGVIEEALCGFVSVVEVHRLEGGDGWWVKVVGDDEEAVQGVVEEIEGLGGVGGLEVHAACSGLRAGGERGGTLGSQGLRSD